MTCGRDRIRSSNFWAERTSCRARVGATETWSAKPQAAGSSWALMTRMTPDSLSLRTRCRVAAGDRPTRRASSTLVRSASCCSAVSSWTSISSSETAIVQNIISLLALTDKFCAAIGDHDDMNTNRRHAFAALVAAGLLWGTTVPLSKLALEWLAPGWLTAVRFGLAAAVLLPVARRRGGLRRGGLRPGGLGRGGWRGRGRILEARVLVSGAVGYGGAGVGEE